MTCGMRFWVGSAVRIREILDTFRPSARAAAERLMVLSGSGAVRSMSFVLVSIPIKVAQAFAVVK